MREPLRLGVAGLGRAFTLMLPTFAQHPGIKLVGAADPRAEARDLFAREFNARSYTTVEELAADPHVEAIYIATPHQFHVAHVQAAARHGRHVLVEKPMALTLAECDQMIAATATANVHMLVGHSHSFDAPYLETARLIASGRYGAPRMLTAIHYTDFLYRPRRPEELLTATGGGVVFSQAAHQVDVIRLLGGGRVSSVRAATGQWDPQRPTEGAYQAFLTFEGGATAALTYSGNARFDTDELMGWSGELGQQRSASSYGSARAALRAATTIEQEIALKQKRAFGSGHVPSGAAPTAAAHNHCGFVIVSCERADLRPMPDSIHIFEDDAHTFVPLAAPVIPRSEVADALVAAVRLNKPAIQSGAWGRATLEVCLAILESARTGQDIAMHYQVGLPPSWA
jgi:phthalate 4,5-cis-dihydrodiol dehydrogenase